MTNEHIWPEWVGRELSHLGEATVTGIGRDRVSASVAALTVKRVCRPCNEGWMSRIEVRVKPILLPLMTATGGQFRLTPDDQEALATWVAMKALLFSLVGSIECVPPDEFRRFREQQRPSREATTVLIGAFMSSDIAAHGTIGFGSLHKSGRNDMYVATLTVWRVVFQIFEYFGPDGFEMDNRLDQFTRIWPPKDEPTNWPPNGTALTDEQFGIVSRPAGFAVHPIDES